MKLIAHRGNINGPNPELENRPDYIFETLAKDFDCEIDVWYVPKSDGWFLGHDKPIYQVTKDFLQHPRLWLHAKNGATISELLKYIPSSNFFFHENDALSVTSHGFVWTCDKDISVKIDHRMDKFILMIPEVDVFECYTELEKEKFDKYRSYIFTGFYALCNDYVGKIKL